MDVHVTLRPSRPEDEPFIRDLFKDVDSERLCLGDWNESDREAILEMQFRARAQHYRDLDADQKECVIEVAGQPAGRMIVIQSAEEIRLADIALVGLYRGRGIGAALIENIQQESRASGRPLRLRVDPLNLSARRVYESLGFYEIDADEANLHLEWTADGPGQGRIHILSGQ